MYMKRLSCVYYSAGPSDHDGTCSDASDDGVSLSGILFAPNTSSDWDNGRDTPSGALVAGVRILAAQGSISS